MFFSWYGNSNNINSNTISWHFSSLWNHTYNLCFIGLNCLQLYTRPTKSYNRTHFTDVESGSVSFSRCCVHWSGRARTHLHQSGSGWGSWGGAALPCSGQGTRGARGTDTDATAQLLGWQHKQLPQQVVQLCSKRWGEEMCHTTALDFATVVTFRKTVSLPFVPVGSWPYLVIFQNWASYIKTFFPGVYPNDCFINDLCFNKQEMQMPPGCDLRDHLFGPHIPQEIQKIKLKFQD